MNPVPDLCAELLASLKRTCGLVPTPPDLRHQVLDAVAAGHPVEVNWHENGPAEGWVALSGASELLQDPDLWFDGRFLFRILVAARAEATA